MFGKEYKKNKILQFSILQWKLVTKNKEKGKCGCSHLSVGG